MSSGMKMYASCATSSIIFVSDCSIVLLIDYFSSLVVPYRLNLGRT